MITDHAASSKAHTYIPHYLLVPVTTVPGYSETTAEQAELPSSALSADEFRAAQKVKTIAATAQLHALLAKKISTVRLQAFEDTGTNADNSHSWVVARYWYNVAYAECLYPALHYLEVGLRKCDLWSCRNSPPPHQSWFAGMLARLAGYSHRAASRLDQGMG